MNGTRMSAPRSVMALSAAIGLAVVVASCSPATTEATTDGRALGDQPVSTANGSATGGTYSGDTSPGSSAPDGSGPGGSEPGSSAPGSAVPGVTAPGSSGPGSSAPGSSAPAGPGASAVPSGWQTFTTSDGTLSFDYPSTWTIQDDAGEAALAGEFVDVLNAEGQPMAALRTNVVTGQVCTERSPYLIFDSEPMQALAESGAADTDVPRFVFEARGDVTEIEPLPPTLAAYGITTAPEPTGDVACPIFQMFLWPPSGALFGQAYRPAVNTTPGDPGLPYLEKARLYAQTPEYQDIRTMITSLRPAAK